MPQGTESAFAQHATDEMVVSLVMRWSGLDPAHKIAWLQLWGIANKRPRTVQIHAKLIGEYQGATDPHRTGSRILKALQNQGLIFVHSNQGGLWTFFLEDPVEVEKRRLVRASSEFQAELFTEPEAKEEEAAAVPFVSGGKGSPDVSVDSAAKASAPTSAPTPPPTMSCDVETGAQNGMLNVDVSYMCDGGQSAKTAFTAQGSSPETRPRGQPKPAHDSSEPSYMETLRAMRDRTYKPPDDDDGKISFAQVVKPAMAKILASAASRPERIRLIVEWIVREIADPKLSKARCFKIADAVASGLYPESDLAKAIEDAKRAVPQSPDVSPASARGKYFNRTMTIVFQRLGLDLSEKKTGSCGNTQHQSVPPEC